MNSSEERRFHLLHADDEKAQHRLVVRRLQADIHRASGPDDFALMEILDVRSGVDAIVRLQDGSSPRPDLVVTDMRMEDAKAGNRVVRAVLDLPDPMPVILYSSEPGALDSDLVDSPYVARISKPDVLHLSDVIRTHVAFWKRRVKLPT